MRGSEHDEQTKFAGHFDLRILSQRGGEANLRGVVRLTITQARLGD
jgi:hypothetical protein